MLEGHRDRGLSSPFSPGLECLGACRCRWIGRWRQGRRDPHDGINNDPDSQRWHTAVTEAQARIDPEIGAYDLAGRQIHDNIEIRAGAMPEAQACDEHVAVGIGSTQSCRGGSKHFVPVMIGRLVQLGAEGLPRFDGPTPTRARREARA